MVEQQKQRLEGAISDMIEDMYRSHLRRMQSTMHRCAASCCDDERGTLDTVQRCIEKCATPLMDAQDYLQNELGQFQNRLQTCVKECNSDARSQLSKNPSEHEMSRSKHLFEVCTGGCVDKHIDLLPGLLKNIQKTLDRGLPRRSLLRD
ncbi:protein FAM136A [Drosophila grimshawi]|uniref:GH20301 n=1 Tax=Drosophila grimshawi TaxID=7222 RepID=B4J522_DROGR|nr:protein FAM136A [Drosophila grimshawi]EDW01728.1 GH20301 [Drosophila grimshawi]EDW05028.1 GH25050 [Drosophila grimshawi]